jgi:hypothetical protein
LRRRGACGHWYTFQVPQWIAVGSDDCGDFDRVRAVCPDHRVVTVFVRAEDGMRVMVLAGQEPAQLVGRWR